MILVVWMRHSTAVMLACDHTWATAALAITALLQLHTVLLMLQMNGNPMIRKHMHPILQRVQQLNPRCKNIITWHSKACRCWWLVSSTVGSLAAACCTPPDAVAVLLTRWLSGVCCCCCAAGRRLRP